MGISVRLRNGITGGRVVEYPRGSVTVRRSVSVRCLMVIVIVSTLNRSTHCHPRVASLGGRKRKRVVRVPGFTGVLVEPV